LRAPQAEQLITLGQGSAEACSFILQVFHA
jgi:hypothetical protein